MLLLKESQCPRDLFFDFFLGLEIVILTDFSASLGPFVDGFGFLAFFSSRFVGSLLDLRRSAPRSGYLV